MGFDRRHAGMAQVPGTQAGASYRGQAVSAHADQRGHDVAWMTAAERDALARLEKATGGPVVVLDVTSEPAAGSLVCGTCGGPVLRVAAEPWERAKLRLPAWAHTAGSRNHTATLAAEVTRVYRSGLPSQHAVTVRYADGSGCTVTIAGGRVSWADPAVWADPGAYMLAPWYCPGHNGGVCQYGACDYIAWTGPDLTVMAAAYEARERDRQAAESAARLSRYARGQVGYRLLG